MTSPSETSSTSIIRARRPPAGTRTRGAVDALQTRLVVALQSLDYGDEGESLAALVEDLPDAVGCDSACIALIDETGTAFETVHAARTGFSQARSEALKGEKLEDWPWLTERLVHLRVVEVSDTVSGTSKAAGELARLNELHIGSFLLTGFAVNGEIAGFLAVFNDGPTENWDASLYLLVKMFAASLATGLERVEDKRLVCDFEEKDALVSDTANDGVWDFDGVSKRLQLSPRWRRMLGYPLDEEDLDINWYHLVHPDDITRVQTIMRQHLEGEMPYFESTHRMKHQDGEWRWTRSRAKAIVDDHGRVIRIVGVETDITETVTYEDALFREKERAQITLQSIGDAVITTDADRNVEYINPVAEELTGWKVDDASGLSIDEIFRAFHEETCEPLENPMDVAISRDRRIKSVRPTLLIRKDGNELYIESTASPIRDGTGRVTGGVLVFHDVSEARELNRRLSYHASHDILTGLVNRPEFEQRLGRALKSAEARETNYALLYLDLDQFKIVNDSCGHRAGDDLLGQLGLLLKSKIRWRDTLARLGGDEFGVLLESCNLEEAIETAESLRKAISEFTFHWEDRPFNLTVSIGVVPITADNEDLPTLLSAADNACSHAKDAGRNRIYSFQENDINLMQRKEDMRWAAKITNALQEDRFELYRQVMLPLRGEEEGAHYEILLRMRDEEGSVVSPALFIEAAERYDKTPEIDRWVIRNTFRWLVSEADERERLALCSINLSRKSLNDEKFLPFVVDQFRMSGLDPTKICFEITETAAVAGYSLVNRFIAALKDLGCKFALDDFGTGLSSYGYLKHFPVDYLKIDGSFVKEILHDKIDREMVRSIAQMGRLTGKQTIAEFAENEEIITMLKGMDIDYAQGYGVSEPKPVSTPIA